MKVFIGLEIHLHVNTAVKMFCRCSADIYGAEPNTHTCPVCLGLPGALPVANLEAIRKTQLLGLALNSTLSQNSRFDRKHYFYPDLPKGYQISQYKNPLCLGGNLEIQTADGNFNVELERIHLEEDAAKSFHEGGKTLSDFNKSGMPLIEIVTKPDFETAEQCEQFCKQIQNIIRTLEVGNGDMEKGQMRLEVNISLGADPTTLPDYKVEIKNINSFRFMKKAIEYEIIRQTELIEAGLTVQQENRGFSEQSGKTVSQREKEQAHDYRYFPEPDIPEMYFDETYFTDLKKELKKTPAQLKDHYLSLGLTAHEANYLSDFENTVTAQKLEELAKSGVDVKKAAKILINKLETRTLSISEFNAMLSDSKQTISDENILITAINKAIENNPNAVEDFKKGKTNSIEFLVGQVMRETKGKGAPDIVRQLIIKTIGA